MNRGNTTAEVKKRVIIAREKQISRANKINSKLTTYEINTYCVLTSEDSEFLEQALMKLGLSARAWHRILKVSRTIADLDGKIAIERKHLIEALSYRSMDKLLIQLHKNIG